MKTIRTFGACAFAMAGLVMQSRAQIQTAGTLLVNIDPSSMPTGSLSWITNSGSVGGVFEATGIATDSLPQIINVGGSGGTSGIMLDRQSFMQHVAAPGGAVVPAPASVVGVNPPCSIEVWAINPTVSTEEAMVAWGARGSNGRDRAFIYGTSGGFGAAGQWGNADLGWNNSGGAPAAGVWHHLVYTYDGTTTRVYADGVLSNSEDDSPYGGLNIIAGTPITLGAQRESNGTVSTGAGRASLTLGKVRIHSGTLTASQISNNYNFEKNSFVLGTPTPLQTFPIHRYTFNMAATNDAVGMTVPDVVGGADGVVQGIYGTATAGFNGSRLSLAGGSSATAPYVDLPNGLVSSLSTNNGGPGKVTIEGWVTATGSQGWQRMFSFGNNTAGEISGPGGTFNGTTELMISQNGGDQNTLHVTVDAVGRDTGGNFGTAFPSLALTYYALTWDEATGEVTVYQNGIESVRLKAADPFTAVNDVNVWLGRSNWSGDNNLQGSYDDFRIYNRVLSPAEVLNDYQGGANTVLVSPGPIQTVHLQVPRANMVAGTFQQVSVSADFQNVTNVVVTTKAGIVYTSSNTNVATVSASGLIVAVSAGTATITTTYQGKSDSSIITVVPVSATLQHRYSFTADISDSVGGPAWDGTVFGGTSFDGHQVVLDSASGSFVQLPSGIISNQDAVTIEAWASIGANANWCELFAFGDQNGAGQGRYLMAFIPHSGGADARMTIADGDPGNTHEQFTARPGVLDGQSNVHITAVYNPLAGTENLYINGQLVGQNTNVNILISGVQDVYSYLGRSLYNGDPLFNGAIDELRIYNGVLTQDKIALDTAAGPDAMVSNPGALQSVHLSVTNQMILNLTQQASLAGNFANVTNVNLFFYGAPTVSSANTNIVTISPSGLIKAVAPGTTTVTASYGAFSDTQTITVSILPAVLGHRYSFAVDASDSIGGPTWDGALFGNATIANGQLVLDGAGSFAQLPSGIINGYYALTVEAWASFGQNNGWVRLFDFGDQTAQGGGNTTAFFSPHDGGNAIRASVSDGAQGQFASRAGNLDNQTNVHVVVVFDPTAGKELVYINDQLAASLNGLNIPLSAVNDVNSWIGRSMFNADPFLVGSIDELRIYSGSLSASQIALNAAAGPTNLVSSPGALQAVHLNATTNMIVDQTQQVQLLADFANVSGVNLFTYATPAPTISSSDTNVLRINASGFATAVGPGKAILSVTYNSSIYTQSVTVVTTPFALKHRYSFSDATNSTTVADSIGGADGTLNGGAALSGTGSLTLDGANGYVQLPAGIISSLTNATIEFWVTHSTAANWQRVFDFGEDNGAGSGLDYLFFAAQGAPGFRFTVKSPTGGESPILDGPSGLLVGVETHITINYNVSAGVASVYQNGQFVLSGAITTPLNLINDVNNWLGRSQFAGDSYFGGVYDEFRIYEGTLTPAEAAASEALGANILPFPSMQVVATGGSIQLSWPSWAARYTTVQSSPTVGSGAVWTNESLTPVRNGDVITVTLPKAGQMKYYRLKN
ncbi:LamG-like jellyroll fold domain-containing protein [Pedosphaera parvula]|uniref:Ig domain protein group 2 domain protein n=1 Tax=Pedosphaera parvula (strain Ellin514) TaxID=320771 RepID=B9XB04_PEDPL|nr:LamG-like jellyroll fold domain-containing protein [Pedosphaera parvula]EEF63189.1 Ig domain protein group 2 domain protein [Pedosphaera parvula Ellin514]